MTKRWQSNRTCTCAPRTPPGLVLRETLTFRPLPGRSLASVSARGSTRHLIERLQCSDVHRSLGTDGSDVTCIIDHA
eukprot:7379760-Prymnesium_polylepis.4